MKVLSVVLIALFITSCSTVSPTCDVPTASGENATTIIIYRPHGVIGALYATPISIDGCRVASLRNNDFHIYYLPHGTHKIAVEKRALELGVGAHIEQYYEKGKVYYLRQNVHMVADLNLVEKSKAIAEMPKLKNVK